MKRHTGQNVVCFLWSMVKKRGHKFIFCRKSYEPCPNKEVYCWKYLNDVKSSHITVCGRVGWNYMMGTYCIVVKRSCVFSSTAFQLILTLFEITRFLVSPWRHFCLVSLYNDYTPGIRSMPWGIMFSSFLCACVCVSVNNFHVRSITLKPLDIFSWNFTQTLNIIRRRAGHKNRNSGLPTFGVIALCVLTIFVFTP